MVQFQQITTFGKVKVGERFVSDGVLHQKVHKQNVGEEAGEELFVNAFELNSDGSHDENLGAAEFYNNTPVVLAKGDSLSAKVVKDFLQRQLDRVKGDLGKISVVTVLTLVAGGFLVNHFFGG